MIRTWHVVASGYTQHEGVLHGCQRLWLSLMALANPHTVVIQPPWDHDWDNLASRISLTSDLRDVRILFYGYSWGCGNGLVKFATALKARALRINHAVLSDPVYRSPWFDPIPVVGHAFRAFGVLRRGTIDLPTNIGIVDWFRQTNGLPYGCDLTGANDIREPVILDLPHGAMDDAPEWHRRCLEVAGLAA